MWSKLVTFWDSLPHYIQALIVLFAGTFATALAHQIEAANACWTLACFKQYFVSDLQAGILAVAGLYLKSSAYKA